MKQSIKMLENNKKKKYKSVHLMKLEQDLSSKNPSPQFFTVLKRPISRAKNGVKLPTDASNIPQPANGSQYTPNDVHKLTKLIPFNTTIWLLKIYQ